MSLDISLHDPTATYVATELYSGNITHNLSEMADAAGIYEALWRPYLLKVQIPEEATYDEECKIEETTIVTALDLIAYLEEGLARLKQNPAEYKKYDAENRWGTYEQFVPFVEEVLAACHKYPKAIVTVSR